MSILNETSPNPAQLACQPTDRPAEAGTVSSPGPEESTKAQSNTFFAPTLIAIGIQIASVAMLAVMLLLLASLRPGDGGADGGGSGNGESGEGGTGEIAAVGPGSGVSDKSSNAGSSETSQEITEVTETASSKESKPDAGKASSRPVVIRKPPENQSGEFVVQDLPKPAPIEQPAEQEHGAGGGDGFSDLGDRLREAGAKSGDVQISLAWNNGNDLDLHVETPGGEKIWYNHRNSSCGGELDVDMNAGGPASQKPVENVFWPVGHSPNGKFRVFVDHYANQGGPDPTKYQVTIKVKGTSKSFTGTLRHGDPPKLVKEFTFP